MKKKEKDPEDYKRSKTEIQESVVELQSSIDNMLDTLETPVDDLFPSSDLLPDFNIQVEVHDYERDIELIKIESKETLECLANLYLNDETMKNKNIYKIIKDDSTQLSDLNFSISCSRRALIGCMKQLDMGVSDPLMYQSVAMFQKEMRDTIKMVYDLQRKMKEFYKELKEELSEINAGEQQEIAETKGQTIIGDPKLLNDLFERYKKDPTLLKDLDKGKEKD